MSPLITVVIPTFGRPELVVRAVRSALSQNHVDHEVVVVVDGPDGATGAALAKIQDDRLRVLTLPSRTGGGGARNSGVEVAGGEWIAFLDDDDEWVPDKLAIQLRIAELSPYRWPVVFSRVRASTPHADYLWPRRAPHAGEAISEYLFLRSGFFQGDGLIQTSTIFAPRHLLADVPFRPELRKHQDWDWVLRAAAAPGVGFEFAPDPLAVWYFEQDKASISSGDDWRYSLEWARQHRELFSARAYAAFLLTTLTAFAARQGDVRAAPVLLREAFRRGHPRFQDLGLFAGIWAIPPRVRLVLRQALSAAKKRGGHRSTSA